MRKESGFEVTDRIDVEIDTTEAIMQSIKQFETYICTEVLANIIEFKTLSLGQKEAIEAEGDTVFNIIKSN
jgi:isoleucyl-tRNA synthetase